MYDPASDEPRERPKRETPFNLYALSAFLVFSAGVLYFGFEFFKDRTKSTPPTPDRPFYNELPGQPKLPVPVDQVEVPVDPSKVPQDPAEQKRFMASVWHQRALAAYSANDRDTARTAWKRCLIIDPGSAACLEGIKRLGEDPSSGRRAGHFAASVRYIVRFDPGSAALSAGNDAVLGRAADTMALYPLDQLVVTGYATLEEGVDLASKRADAVRARLEEKGVPGGMSLETRLQDGPMAASAVIQIKRK